MTHRAFVRHRVAAWAAPALRREGRPGRFLLLPALALCVLLPVLGPGCRSDQGPPALITELTPRAADRTTTNAPTPAPSAPTTAPVPAPVHPVQTAAASLFLAPTQVVAKVLRPWVPAGQWGREHGFPQIQHSVQAAEDRYDLRGPAGHLRLLTGSTVAQWNGVELWLGLAPRLVDGHPCVSGLDAEKSLEPLLAGGWRATNPRPTIVLDPGHGGVGQPGAKNILYNRFEKEYTLDWAAKLAVLLRVQGWNVILTRTDDRDVSLSNRVAIAQSARADLFVSLHFNSSYPRADQSGVETYCMTPAGMPSSITRVYGDDPRAVTPNNAFDRENLQLAMLLHRGILEATGAPDRGVRHARFMGVLKGQERPSVLIEGGYLSNPREAALIASAAYRQKLASGVAEALGGIRAPGVSAVTQK